jgi:DnaJ-class molecular chaperone
MEKGEAMKPKRAKCIPCNGTGRLIRWLRAWSWQRGVVKMPDIVICGACTGTGEVSGD